jgi:Tfp pilus assembly protein PilN
MRINLAPEITQETSFRELTPALLVAAITIGAGYFLPTWYAEKIKTEAQEIETKTAELKQQLSALEADLAKAKALQSDIAEINQRKSAIENLAGDRRYIVAVLEKIQDIHHEKIWITNLKFDSTSISIKGWATDYKVVSEYTSRIKATNGQSPENGLEPKDFVPSFLDEETKKTQKMQADSAAKKSDSVKFTDLEFKGSQTQPSPDASKMPIQQFEIVFNPNVGMK